MNLANSVILKIFCGKVINRYNLTTEGQDMMGPLAIILARVYLNLTLLFFFISYDTYYSKAWLKVFSVFEGAIFT